MMKRRCEAINNKLGTSALLWLLGTSASLDYAREPSLSALSVIMISVNIQKNKYSILIY